MSRLVIVGAGMATSRLLTELVHHDHPFTIQVIGEEPDACYNRILLSSMLAGDKSLADTCLIGADWYVEHGIELVTGEKVTALDCVRRQLVTDAARAIDYDILVLATGSLPFMPPIPGREAENVLAFRNLDDLRRINGFAGQGGHATIIGGGLLGLEAAHGLRGLGLATTVINREDWLMPRQLSQPAAAVLQSHLETQGVQFRLGMTPRQITHEAGLACGVTLSNDETLATDLVLVTAGIVPNAELGRAGNLACDRGILIDGHMRTSAEGVYALGECTQLGDRLFGLVTPVYRQAAVLAAILCGANSEPFIWEDAPTQLKISGVDVVSAGDPAAPALNEKIVSDTRLGIYRRLLFRDERLVGYELIGDRTHSAAYASHLQPEVIDSTDADPVADLMFACKKLADGNDAAPLMES